MMHFLALCFNSWSGLPPECLASVESGNVNVWNKNDFFTCRAVEFTTDLCWKTHSVWIRSAVIVPLPHLISPYFSLEDIFRLQNTVCLTYIEIQRSIFFCSWCPVNLTNHSIHHIIILWTQCYQRENYLHFTNCRHIKNAFVTIEHG